MNYSNFAYLYDQLMIDAPYEKWVSFVMEKMKQYEIVKGKLLDLGCGTGNISIPLNKYGYDVVAVDLSEDMLMIAKEKNDQQGTTVQFYQQDMRELDGLGDFHTIVSLCDCLNYLKNESELEATLSNVYRHLLEGGIFIFDVHSIYKMEHIFKDSTFAYNGEEISYIWECHESDAPYSVEHDLSFFVRQENGLYKRYDETHYQRTYSIETFKRTLERTGFKVEFIGSDFRDALHDAGERWFFIARK